MDSIFYAKLNAPAARVCVVNLFVLKTISANTSSVNLSRQIQYFHTTIVLGCNDQICRCFFKNKNGPSPLPLFHLISSFQTSITIFTTKKCEKCQSSIWCWDSNPQRSGYESPAITTRPGLPPFMQVLFCPYVSGLIWAMTIQNFFLLENDKNSRKEEENKKMLSSETSSLVFWAKNKVFFAFVPLPTSTSSKWFSCLLLPRQ